MSRLSMSDIVKSFGSSYSSTYPCPLQHYQVMTRITQCRTVALGGVELTCQTCGATQVQYHSCRDRHCPKCQRKASDAWRQARQEELLPASYFHLVFTLPHELNPWIQLHPREIYGLLFKAVWATLMQFGKDPKRLNGQLGMTAVLHTWGQKLDRHVHLHCLVPAGAWSETEKSWHPANSNYLFPVKALSRYFRGMMVSLLRQAKKENVLERIKTDKEDKLTQLMKQDWVVYTKACHGRPEQVLDYLSRYTYKTALNESRLLSMNQEQIRFRWKDYRDEKHKIMTLSGLEFLRRFMQHILQKGFMRISHFGFLSNRHKRERLQEIKANLNQRDVESKIDEQTDVELMPMIKPEPWYCMVCKSYHVEVSKVIEPLLRRTRKTQ